MSVDKYTKRPFCLVLNFYGLSISPLTLNFLISLLCNLTKYLNKCFLKLKTKRTQTIRSKSRNNFQISRKSHYHQYHEQIIQKQKSRKNLKIPSITMRISIKKLILWKIQKIQKILHLRLSQRSLFQLHGNSSQIQILRLSRMIKFLSRRNNQKLRKPLCNNLPSSPTRTSLSIKDQCKKRNSKHLKNKNRAINLLQIPILGLLLLKKLPFNQKVGKGLIVKKKGLKLRILRPLIELTNLSLVEIRIKSSNKIKT